jgi:hypothetical protein
MEKNSVVRMEHNHLCQKPSTMKLATTVVFLLVMIWPLWSVWSLCWVKLGYLFMYLLDKVYVVQPYITFIICSFISVSEKMQQSETLVN